LCSISPLYFSMSASLSVCLFDNWVIIDLYIFCWM
jgi:hypothetical protein